MPRFPDLKGQYSFFLKIAHFLSPSLNYCYNRFKLKNNKTSFYLNFLFNFVSIRHHFVMNGIGTKKSSQGLGVFERIGIKLSKFFIKKIQSSLKNRSKEIRDIE